MRLGACSVTNFGSYKELQIDFGDLGLSLLYGPTGSGKSTICDMACWILYGTTAKDGSVDEVRSWLTEEATTGCIEVIPATGETLVVVRTRGKPSENDLYWLEDETEFRGKDITETQKLLEQRLGVTSKQFLSSAYFSEFSSVGGFFRANSKHRRGILEEVANLEFPIKIAQASQIAKKDAKTQEHILRQEVEHLESRVMNAKQLQNWNDIRALNWKKKHQEKLRELQEKSNRFIEDDEKTRLQLSQKASLWAQGTQSQILSIKSQLQPLIDNRPIEAIQKEAKVIQLKLANPSTCGECKQPVANQELYEAKSILDAEYISAKRALVELAVLREKLEALETQENPYLDTLEDPKNVYHDMLVEERKSLNPFLEAIEAAKAERAAADAQLEQTIIEYKNAQDRYSALEQIYNLSFELRGKLLQSAIEEIEAQTNRYLETYFDSEIKVSLTIEGSDKLETLIYKSGYECAYTQLSKGQRGLLRLCFSVSVMEIAANKTGEHFNLLMFDESLDGLDAELKVKSYDLFTELSTRHPSILLIEHASEFQNLFENKYVASLRGDESILSHE